jgi:N-acetylmuramoyl-L-alanine amidase
MNLRAWGLVVAAAGATLAGAAEHRVRDVRFWPQGELTRIAIETTAEVPFKFDRLQNPDRIYFDLYGVAPRIHQEMLAVDGSVVRQIRIALTQPNVTRVVLDLAAPVEMSSSWLNSPSRLVIEVMRIGPGAPMAPAPQTPPVITPPERTPGTVISRKPVPLPPAHTRKATAPRPFLVAAQLPRLRPLPTAMALSGIRPPYGWKIPPAAPPPAVAAAKTYSEPAPAAKAAAPPVEAAAVRLAAPIAKSKPPVLAPEPPAAETASTPALEATPAKTTRSGATSLTRALGLKLRRVVLDPGHGGHDTGTISKGGLREKDVVLDVAKRLAVLIEERMGSEVVLTRDDDRFVPLEDRTAIANRHKADLFLSIHANSSAYRNVAGVETFYLNFSSSKSDLEVAARENASSSRSVHDLSDLVKKIALNDKLDESREFAARLQSAGYELAVKSHGKSIRNRGVKKAPFVVLIGAEMPSVLVEIGFMTNAREEALFRRSEHRDEIAEALFNGLSRYANTLSNFRVAQTGGKSPASGND